MRRPLITPDPILNPARWSLVCSLIYILLCTGYIIYSDKIATWLARSPQELERLQTFKGVGFVLITGGIFFVVSCHRWQKISRQARLISRQHEALVRAEARMVALASIKSVVHDLNNLLMTLTGLAEELRALAPTDPAVRQMIADLESRQNRLGAFCQRILTVSERQSISQSDPVDLSTTLPEIIAAARRHPDVRYCTFRSRLQPDVGAALVNENLLEQALLNLVINAAQAGGAQCTIEVSLRRDGAAAVIEVHDNGSGVPPELRESIFEPCFTTKPQGSGLGLVSVAMFAQSCGGQVSCAQSPLGGAMFRLTIPVLLRQEASPRKKDLVAA